MKQITRYIMSLAALLALTMGAWAQDTYTVTFKDQGNTVTVENVTLPKTFSCNYGNGELDLIIQELYELDEGWCDQDAPNSSGSENVTCGLDGDNHFITVSAPFDGTATVTGKYNIHGGAVITYSLEITCPGAASDEITVTTDAASEQDVFTTASFTMPASNVKVSYELVRDMQDNDNPVEFTGLPDDGKITVAAGEGGNYQPTEALDIQLTDQLAEEGSQNIIEADGITVNVLVGAENGQGAIDYDQDNPITLDAFLADMKPGYYWIKAEPKDETSQYYGTVYSKELTVAEAAYSTSVNIEQLVLDNGVKYDITKDFIDSYIEYASINALDTLNDLENKAMRNEPYLGLKLKTKGAYIKVLVKKGSTLNVKFGAVKEALGVSIGGTAKEAIAATDEGTTYSYEATDADAEVTFTTASNKTVVFKQIMIDEPLADVTLPEPGAYLITVATPENGTAAVDWADKKYRTPVGAEVTVTATPAEGYEVEAITVTGATSNTAYEVSADGKFTMPGEEVTVSATFKQITGIDGINADEAVKADGKYVEDGKIVIYRNGAKYTVGGKKMK